MADAAPERAAAALALAGFEDVPDDAPAAVLTARMAELVQALRCADTAHAAARKVVSLAACPTTKVPQRPRTCIALVETGAVDALLQLLPSGVTASAAAHPLTAVQSLAASCQAARLAAHAAGGLAVLLRLVHAGVHERAAADVVNCVLSEEAACATADAALVGQLLLLLQNEALSTSVAVALLRATRSVTQQHAANRKLFWDAGGVPVLMSLLLRHDVHALPPGGPSRSIASAACTVFVFLQLPIGGVDNSMALYDAGLLEAVMPLLRAPPGVDSALWEPHDNCHAPSCVIATAYNSPAKLQPHIRYFMANTPGALAGVALSALAAQIEAGRTLLVQFLGQLLTDKATDDDSASWLLDTHFVVSALLELRSLDVAGAAGVAHRAVCARFITSWSTAGALRALAHPLAQHRLAAAASLALLSGDGDHFRAMLAGASRLETLLTAFAACDNGSAPAQWTCNWKRRALHKAIKTAVAVAGLTAVVEPSAAGADLADAEPPPAKRQRSSGPVLRAEDVNVRRRDSTVLHIAGQPFYVDGRWIESKSVVLADALRDTTTLDPIPLPLPRGVPADQHYAIFRAAVEHAYTGTVDGLDHASLLPLWCLGDHLQMDELRAWCVEQMLSLMRKDGDMLEAVWAAALARPCDALCDACVSAWLVSVAAASASDTAPLELLARVQAGCAAGVSLTVQAASVLRKALQPPAAGAAAGA
jgi:hypothetical protein